MGPVSELTMLQKMEKRNTGVLCLAMVRIVCQLGSSRVPYNGKVAQSVFAIVTSMQKPEDSG